MVVLFDRDEVVNTVGREMHGIWDRLRVKC